jgi:hypothetical protein
MFQDRVPQGIDYLEKALELARSADDTTEQGNILNMLASARW